MGYLIIVLGLLSLLGFFFGLTAHVMRNILLTNGSQEPSRLITGSDEQWESIVRGMEIKRNIAFTTCVGSIGALYLIANFAI